MNTYMYMTRSGDLEHVSTLLSTRYDLNTMCPIHVCPTRWATGAATMYIYIHVVQLAKFQNFLHTTCISVQVRRLEMDRWFIHISIYTCMDKPPYPLPLTCTMYIHRCLLYFVWVSQRHRQYCIPVYSQGQSSPWQYSTITEAGSDATLLKQSASTRSSTMESCCTSNLTLKVGLDTKIQHSAFPCAV